MAGHGLPAVVVLREVGVVGATHQPDVVHAVVTAEAERAPVMVLEPIALRTPSALPVRVAALPPVAPVNLTPDGRGNVA